MRTCSAMCEPPPLVLQAVEGRGGGQGELLLPTAGSGWQELTVAVVRLPGEKQLGVSLSGGREEGTCPRIDAITGGRPTHHHTHTHCNLLD